MFFSPENIRQFDQKGCFVLFFTRKQVFWSKMTFCLHKTICAQKWWSFSPENTLYSNQRWCCFFYPKIWDILTRNDVVFDGSLALVSDDDAVPQAVGDGVPAHHGTAATSDVHPAPLVAGDRVVCNQSVHQLVHQQGGQSSVSQRTSLPMPPTQPAGCCWSCCLQSVSQSMNQSAYSSASPHKLLLIVSSAIYQSVIS